MNSYDLNNKIENLAARSKKVSPPLQPEFFALLGIDIFLAASLLTCLLDRHFPKTLPYMYQIAALAGFGHLLISREFMTLFGGYMRFWYSMVYLIVAITNVVAANVYLLVWKKLQTLAQVFLYTVTAPVIAISALFVSNYTDIASHQLLLLPSMSLEWIFVVVVAFDTFVVGASTYIFFKPKWWHVAAAGCTMVAGASAYALAKPAWGDATFVVSAIALGIACVMVLGASVYVLLRTWLEEHKKKRVGR
jgi:hypothetical protein